MHTWERLIWETTAAWEQDGMAHGERRPIIGAVDETFLQRMMLVCMDWAPGYVLMDAVAPDRRFDTWDDRANTCLTTLGTKVLSLVSDRAKALIKLAQTGLGCPSIPDVLPVGHDLANGYALGLFGRLRQAKRDLDHAKQHLETVQKHPRATLPTSSKPRPGSQPAPPWSIPGRRWARPGGSIWPMCRAFCIPGGL